MPFQAARGFWICANCRSRLSASGLENAQSRFAPSLSRSRYRRNALSRVLSTQSHAIVHPTWSRWAHATNPSLRDEDDDDTFRIDQRFHRHANKSESSWEMDLRQEGVTLQSAGSSGDVDDHVEKLHEQITTGTSDLRYLASYSEADLGLLLWILRAPTPQNSLSRLLRVRNVPVFAMLEVLRRNRAAHNYYQLSASHLQRIIDLLWERLPPHLSVIQVEPTLPIDYSSINEASHSHDKPNNTNSDGSQGKTLLGEILVPGSSRSHPENHSTVTDADVAKGALFSPDEIVQCRPMVFQILIELTKWARHQSPARMANVAHVAVGFMEHMMELSVLRANRQTKRLLDLMLNQWANDLIQEFRWPATSSPFKNSCFNWEAQKLLLEFCSRSDPPIVLTRSTYRALTAVILAQKKSASEQSYQASASRSWPPWPTENGQLVPRKAGQQYDSLAIKIMEQMTNDGFSASALDNALRLLGGRDIDSSPTIAARTFPLISNKDIKGTADGPLDWAARVRTTRDKQEAWNAFLSCESSGTEPTADVYHEMLCKLVYEHRQAVRWRVHGAHPSDGQEALPVYDQNLSDFERARIRPPTKSQLYLRMIRAGIRPSGGFLRFLVRTASSVGEVFQYLSDAQLPDVDVHSILWTLRIGEPETMTRVPSSIDEHLFEAIISVLCRLGGAIWNTTDLPPSEIHKAFRVHHAPESPFHSMALRQYYVKQRRDVMLPLVVAISLVTKFRPVRLEPWRQIFEALRNQVDTQSLKELRGFSGRDHQISAWHLARRLIQEMSSLESSCDGYIFASLCMTFEHALHVKPGKDFRKDGVDVLNRYFDELSQVCAPTKHNPYSNARLIHQVEGAHLHAYIRVLGSVRDQKRILHVLRFIVENREQLGDLVNVSGNGRRMFSHALTAARLYLHDSEQLLEAETLLSSVEDTDWIFWPSETDVEAYLSHPKRAALEKRQSTDMFPSARAVKRIETSSANVSLVKPVPTQPFSKIRALLDR